MEDFSCSSFGVVRTQFLLLNPFSLAPTFLIIVVVKSFRKPPTVLPRIAFFCCEMRKSVNRPPTPDAVEEQEEKEPSLQEVINVKLVESGEKERLMELLRERLIECGWKDEMKALCR
ncbi:unnamed protein product [Linum tenue]|nr:unnamed protein product [Linum tenue]